DTGAIPEEDDMSTTLNDTTAEGQQRTDTAATTTTTETITDRANARRRLPDDATLLEFRDRARIADDRNEYFHDDLAVLRSIGYLGAAVPAEHGGWGLALSELARQQRRLARYAPATALAMCMHHYWVGIAVELERAGDDSCRWLFERAVVGDVL